MRQKLKDFEAWVFTAGEYLRAIPVEAPDSRPDDKIVPLLQWHIEMHSDEHGWVLMTTAPIYVYSYSQMLGDSWILQAYDPPIRKNVVEMIARWPEPPFLPDIGKDIRGHLHDHFPWMFDRGLTLLPSRTIPPEHGRWAPNRDTNISQVATKRTFWEPICPVARPLPHPIADDGWYD